MGTLQILFLFLENHCKFEDENKEEDLKCAHFLSKPVRAGMFIVSQRQRNQAP